MKTTKTIWMVNNNPTITGAELHTNESLREDFGDETWMVAFTGCGKNRDEDRLVDCMTWDRFCEFLDQNDGQVGWLHIMTGDPEEEETILSEFFGTSTDKYICPMVLNDASK